MPSDNATLNHERERAQRYAHQGAAGTPNYDTVRDERDGHSGPVHPPNGNTSHRHKGKDETFQTSCSKQEHGDDTPMSNGDLSHNQCDDCCHSDDLFQPSSSRMMIRDRDSNVIHEQEQFKNPYRHNRGWRWGCMRGGHGDDIKDHHSSPKHHAPIVENGCNIEDDFGRVEHGESSRTAANRQHTTDDGLHEFRARHATSGAEDEEAEILFKKYLETSRQEHYALQEAEAIERILRQERADLERRSAQRTATESRPQAQQAQGQVSEHRKAKGKELAATNNSARPREEMDNRHGAAESPQANTHLQAEGVGRDLMGERRVGQVHDIHECITCLPHVDLRWGEAEHARVLARLRASRQVADEAYLRLLRPDSWMKLLLCSADPQTQRNMYLQNGHIKDSAMLDHRSLQDCLTCV